MNVNINLSIMVLLHADRGAPMVIHTEFILQLTVLLIAASIGGIVASRFRYPSALGELIAGILIGLYALSVVEHSEILLVFAELHARANKNL
jgi:Kef-type K+ transport system membrane component KefB